MSVAMCTMCLLMCRISARDQVHYVPLESPFNIGAVLAWLRKHDAEAQRIVANANTFIRTFLVRERCALVRQLVLQGQQLALVVAARLHYRAASLQPAERRPRGAALLRHEGRRQQGGAAVAPASSAC